MHGVRTPLLRQNLLPTVPHVTSLVEPRRWRLLIQHRSGGFTLPGEDCVVIGVRNDPTVRMRLAELSDTGRRCFPCCPFLTTSTARSECTCIDLCIHASPPDLFIFHRLCD